MCPVPHIAAVVGGPGTQAVHPAARLGLHLLLGLQHGVVMDVVVMDVFGGLLGDEALCQQGTRC